MGEGLQAVAAMKEFPNHLTALRAVVRLRAERDKLLAANAALREQLDNAVAECKAARRAIHAARRANANGYDATHGEAGSLAQAWEVATKATDACGAMGSGT